MLKALVDMSAKNGSFLGRHSLINSNCQIKCTLLSGLPFTISGDLFCLSAFSVDFFFELSSLLAFAGVAKIKIKCIFSGRSLNPPNAYLSGPCCLLKLLLSSWRPSPPPPRSN